MFLLVDEPGLKGVYKQSQILGNEAAAYSLDYTCIIAPLLSEHNQGLGRIRCSVLLIALASIYYMRALLCSPHVPCSIGFPRFLSACCTLLWVVDSVGNCIHRRKR